MTSTYGPNDVPRQRPPVRAAKPESPQRQHCIAVIGPSNPARVARASGMPEEAYALAAYRVGELLAARGARMVVVPDRGVALDAMSGYLDAGGTDLIGLAPSSGVCEPAARKSISANRDRCHAIVDDLSWYEQHSRIGAVSDAMICVGLSSGTLVEIAWTKWNPGPSIALVEGTCTALPPELEAEVDAKVLPLVELNAWIDAQPLTGIPVPRTIDPDVKEWIGGRS